MAADINLQFIREKIYKTRSAIMYSMCNDLVKLPNSIVTAVKVDDDGNLWFVCNTPSVLLDQCASSFPARLHFYRKGTFFHMEVSGKAEIVNNEFKTSSDDKEIRKPLLLKMTMANIEYTEPQEKKKTVLDQWLEKAGQWVVRNIAISRHEKPVLSQLHSMNN